MEFGEAGDYPSRTTSTSHWVGRLCLARSTHMKRPLLAIILATAVALPAFAALKPGDTAPDFSAQASLAGKAFAFSLSDARRKGPVVVYFYPSASDATGRSPAPTTCKSLLKSMDSRTPAALKSAMALPSARPSSSHRTVGS
jgi:hypothetical protein